MRRLLFSPVVAGAVISQLFAGLAAAGTKPSKAEAPRVVYVCDNSPEMRQAWAREFGAPMSFVTADELAAAQAVNEGWSSPRCIAASELQRFKTDHADVARLIRTEADRRTVRTPIQGFLGL